MAGPSSLLSEVEEFFVHVAPMPVLDGVQGLDDRMAGLLKVLGCMHVLRGIAAADVAADHAHPQMDPLSFQLYTLLAPRRTRADIADLIHMGARDGRHRHISLRNSCTN